MVSIAALKPSKCNQCVKSWNVGVRLFNLHDAHRHPAHPVSVMILLMTYISWRVKTGHQLRDREICRKIIRRFGHSVPNVLGYCCCIRGRTMRLTRVDQ